MAEETVIEFNIGEFRGNFPDVDIAAGVDMEALKELDASPFFATLPIVPEVGAISGNGLLYDDELVASLETQINEKRPGGIFGHLKEEERGTSFPLPSGLWVGAKRVGNTLWGKAYLPPGEGREHMRRIKALGGEIATSIYGKGTFEKVRDGVRRLTDFKLESLDFAPPARAALGYGAIPHVTSEMSQEQEAEMPNLQEIISELRSAKVPPAGTWVAGSEEEVSEMTVVRELLGADEQANVPALIAEMQGQLAEYRQATVNARISELVTDGVKLPRARGIVTRLVKANNPQSVEEAEAAYASVIEMEDVAELLTVAVQAAAGPSAIVNGRVQATGAFKPLEDTPENRKAAVAAMRINI